ncbi:MAG TPA: glycosyltransferase family 4 protein [Cryptosporangiaceae bacterium]|nr:glycosyltransferase family 4 protein [Cryptosporangiaceae bacterium]
MTPVAPPFDRGVGTTTSARRRLRIAMIAPPYFGVPPEGYGGVEAVAADLVDDLVDRGHHVTLVAAGSHQTKAQEFLATCAQPRSDRVGEPMPELAHAARAAELLHGCAFDLVHDHTLAGPLLARGRTTPTLATVHSSLTEDFGAYYRALGRTVRLVGISGSQRRAAPDLPWVATVHNGIRVDTFPFRAAKEDLAVFLGRFHPHKAPHLAIDAARAAGLRIVLAGKCQEPVEHQYFAREITPRLGPDATVFGVAGAREKRQLLARARCLLFPIRWDEPFGLVMVEAMACGTPVVALRRGSVPEVVVHGRTGVVVDHPAELAAAIDQARDLDPAACRNHVEERFSTEAMTAGYEATYDRLLTETRTPSLALLNPASTPRSLQTGRA